MRAAAGNPSKQMTGADGASREKGYGLPVPPGWLPGADAAAQVSRRSPQAARRRTLTCHHRPAMLAGMLLAHAMDAVADRSSSDAPLRLGYLKLPRANIGLESFYGFAVSWWVTVGSPGKGLSSSRSPANGAVRRCTIRPQSVSVTPLPQCSAAGHVHPRRRSFRVASMVASASAMPRDRRPPGSATRIAASSSAIAAPAPCRRHRMQASPRQHDPAVDPALSGSRSTSPACGHSGPAAAPLTSGWKPSNAARRTCHVAPFPTRTEAEVGPFSGLVVTK